MLEQKEKSQTRKLDTRRKIIVGGAVLAEMHKDPEFAAVVRALLLRYVARPNDRDAVADLLRRPIKIWCSLRSQVFYRRGFASPAPPGMYKGKMMNWLFSLGRAAFLAVQFTHGTAGDGDDRAR